jgi:hypothetical protein
MRRFFWLLSFVLLACSDDHGHNTLDPICADIVNRCHALDRGPGVIHDCHQLAEGNNAAMCSSRRTECLASCVASDGGAGDAAADAASGG